MYGYNNIYDSYVAAVQLGYSEEVLNALRKCKSIAEREKILIEARQNNGKLKKEITKNTSPIM